MSHIDRVAGGKERISNLAHMTYGTNTATCWYFFALNPCMCQSLLSIPGPGSGDGRCPGIQTQVGLTDGRCDHSFSCAMWVCIHINRETPNHWVGNPVSQPLGFGLYICLLPGGLPFSLQRESYWGSYFKYRNRCLCAL